MQSVDKVQQMCSVAFERGLFHAAQFLQNLTIEERLHTSRMGKHTDEKFINGVFLTIESDHQIQSFGILPDFQKVASLDIDNAIVYRSPKRKQQIAHALRFQKSGLGDAALFQSIQGQLNEGHRFGGDEVSQYDGVVISP